jgi:hypothetical protein
VPQKKKKKKKKRGPTPTPTPTPTTNLNIPRGICHYYREGKVQAVARAAWI